LRGGVLPRRQTARVERDARRDRGGGARRGHDDGSARSGPGGAREGGRVGGKAHRQGRDARRSEVRAAREAQGGVPARGRAGGQDREVTLPRRWYEDPGDRPEVAARQVDSTNPRSKARIMILNIVPIAVSMIPSLIAIQSPAVPVKEKEIAL